MKLIFTILLFMSTSSINIALTNTTDTVQSYGLFDIQEVLFPTGSGVTEYTGKVFNTGTIVTSGDQLPNNLCIGIYESNNNIYVSTTLGGIWIYNQLTGEGKKFTTITPVTSGDQLPNNFCPNIYQSNNKIYVATSGGVWIYNELTGEGKTFTTVTPVASGDQLPNNGCNGIYLSNNKIYVATSGGVWIYNELTDEGKTFTTITPVSSGDQLTSNTCYIIYQSDNKIYVATAFGIWIYNELTGAGKRFITVTPVTSGDQLPFNGCAGIYQSDNKIYVATGGGGVWIYNELTGEGKLFTTVTPVVSGDQLPSNVCIRIYQSNNEIYVSTTNGIWIYDELTGEGKVFNTGTIVTSGDQLPNNLCIGIYESNNNIYVSTTVGIWTNTITIPNPVTATTNDTSTTYSEAVIDLTASPTKFNTLKVSYTNILDLTGAFQYVTRSVSGQLERYQLDVISSKTQDGKINVLNVDLENFIIDKDHYFEVTLQPHQNLELLFNPEKQVNDILISEFGYFHHKDKNGKVKDNQVTVFKKENGQKKNNNEVFASFTRVYNSALDNYNISISKKQETPILAQIIIAGAIVLLIKKMA